MSTRTKLPWNLIALEVTAAVINHTTRESESQGINRSVPYRPLVANAVRIAAYMRSNTAHYPLTTDCGKATSRLATSRVSCAMRKMGWKEWNMKSGATGKKFVIPWEKVLP